MFIKKGKNNWFFVCIVFAFAVIIGGGLLYELETIKIELSNLDGSIRKISREADTETIEMTEDETADDDLYMPEEFDER